MQEQREICVDLPVPSLESLGHFQSVPHYLIPTLVLMLLDERLNLLEFLLSA